MAKTYDPHAIEKNLYEAWEDAGHFRPTGGETPYCIMLPPPNVTGSLHMGHAFQDTLMDALTRYHRMRGANVLWQCGTDHAGIATQMVVERQLGQKGISRHDLGREKFLEAVWAWKEESGGTISKQLRRMGASMDWSRERFTMDAGLSRAVTEVFVKLYEDGLIYRGKRLVNWDPVLNTAISDLEVVATEEAGKLWHIRYPLEHGAGHVVVATTRPETMLGDVAVAVHPDDERYQRIIGKTVRLPLCDRSIPVIADTYVDPGFGSGCVKITPAHDFNDYAVGERHKLPLINVFTDHAAINDDAPEQYRGLDRYAARARIVEDLKALGLLVRIDDHKLMVPRGDRSHAVIEPYLTDQWFVRIAPLAEPAIAAVEDGRIRFVPENWSKTYFEWMRNIEDWCISRQLWWGHRIPAWYDAEGTIYVGRTEAEARERGGLGADVVLTQDDDVLDTWFSSALWPFSTLGWPERTPELATFYPTSVLVTGFDIIFFWVARMIMMGLRFMGDVPFREVYIHGLVRDADGNKMSKSKGNILDPIDLIDGIDLETLVGKRTTGLMRPEDAPKIEAATRRQFAGGIPSYGCDALRFTFASLATQGRDIRFDLGRIEGYRNFCNKIWNAARFVLMMVEGHDLTNPTEHTHSALPERWIRSRLHHAVRVFTEAFDGYRFDLAAQAIYEFIWNEFCDWYIELAKVELNDPDTPEALKRGTRRALASVLETSLRLLHPLMPFITEEIWLKVAPLVGKTGRTIMHEPFPRLEDDDYDDHAIATFDWLATFILGVRRIRAENNIEPAKRLAVKVRGGAPFEQLWLQEYALFVRQLARLETIERVEGGDSEDAATALAGETTILVPLMDLIDPAVEIERLTKELARLEQDLTRTEAKLANESFVAKAPPEVVDKERRRALDNRDAIGRLTGQLTKLRK
ncbi:MAG: valine--tRNA ligase [Gammaproteobacteria bacterium]|nr:valine--tRNA ligase [Gammaproteobacteria bacterium]